MSLERKVAILDAIESIRRISALYAKAGDAQNDAKQMRKLFADDAVLEAKGFGRYEGLDEVLGGLAQASSERVLWGMHFPVSPIIDISEDLQSAHAFWWLWEVTVMRSEDGLETESMFLGANYDTDLVLIDGEWKIKHMTLDVKTTIPFKGGSIPEPS